MNEEVSHWSDEESGLSISIKPLAQGLCSMEFRLEDLYVTINCSHKALVTACLGARSHFASEDGTCEVIRRGERVRLSVQQWRGPAAVIEVSGKDFETAVSSLEGQEPSLSREIKLF